MKTIKKIAPLVIMLIVFAVATTQTFAAYDATNENTGYDSDNYADAYEGYFSDIDNNSDATVVTMIDPPDIETGNNEASYNTGSGEAESGGIEGEVEIENDRINDIDTLDSNEWEGDFTAANDTTGYESYNEAYAYVESDVDVNNESGAYVDNYADVTGDTGSNEASYNTGEGITESGDADFEIVEANIVNSNYSEIELSGCEFTAENTETGYDSDNYAYAYEDNEVDVTNTNYADVINVAEVIAETGNNEASYNTGGGEVLSGEAEAEVNIKNDVNYNESYVEIDLEDAEFIATNDTTGYESCNEAYAYAENDVDVTNDNTAIVASTGKAEAYTGDNEASYNTGSGEIESGDATAKVDIDNSGSINENVTTVNIELGDSNFEAINTETGYDSDNYADAYETNDVDVENNNGAEIVNNATATADTGNNEASYNTGSGEVLSGEAEATSIIINDVNINETNISFEGDSEFIATNDTTGYESYNETAAYVENTAIVTNNNTANIVNNVTTASNSGGNEASYNTGSGNAKSGDTTITFSVTNNANSSATNIGK